MFSYLPQYLLYFIIYKVSLQATEGIFAALNIRIIYDNGTNQSFTIHVLGNYIKCNFSEFDYIISVHVIRYMYDICLVYNFASSI